MHSGHRERLRNRFIHNNGAEGIENHEILEMALFYAIPRRNTNNISHELINKFGSIASVFDAPIKLLKEVDGMGESSAAFIKLIPELARIYMEDKYSPKGKVLTEIETYEKLMLKFTGKTYEAVAIALFDAKGKLVYDGLINKGNVNSVDIYIRRIVELIMMYNASSIIVAHNHPSGYAVPSKEDIASTIRLGEVIRNMGAAFLDHIVVADDDYISINQSNICPQAFA